MGMGERLGRNFLPKSKVKPKEKLVPSRGHCFPIMSLGYDFISMIILKELYSEGGYAEPVLNIYNSRIHQEI